MNSYMVSIRPEWVKKIVNGEKIIEVRKSAPKELPFKAYIYCTKDRKNLLPIERGKVLQKVNFWENTDAYYGFGKVIGEFICDKVERFSVGSLRSDDIEKLACLSYNEMINYFYKPEELDGKTAKQGFAWHISDLKIYDKPKELSEFWGRKTCLAADTVECWNCFATCLVINGKHCQPITRPPQSYMFVEEVGE